MNNLDTNTSQKRAGGPYTSARVARRGHHHQQAKILQPITQPTELNNIRKNEATSEPKQRKNLINQSTLRCVRPLQRSKDAKTRQSRQDLAAPLLFLSLRLTYCTHITLKQRTTAFVQYLRQMSTTSISFRVRIATLWMVILHCPSCKDEGTVQVP